MDRNELIALSVKYNGDYKKIFKASKKGERVKPLDNIPDCITILDDNYPSALLSLEDPPFVLYYKGDIGLLKKKKIGIIGSRKICEYASEAVKMICETVNKRKSLCVVSGLALGADGYAHFYADHSIGVLPCGIDVVYPKNNQKLYDKLSESGLIISEYPPGVNAEEKLFLERNRIVAKLCDELMVVQVEDKSGTLSTINRAVKYGVPVDILPYRITDEEGKFSNTLIGTVGKCLKI